MPHADLLAHWPYQHLGLRSMMRDADLAQVHLGVLRVARVTSEAINGCRRRPNVTLLAFCSAKKANNVTFGHRPPGM
jgi:hypothetical protein